MKCPYCENEMEKGKASFTSVQGFSPMMLLYSSDEESKKGVFKRETKGRIILSGEEAEAYYCQKCKKLIPVFDEE